MDSLTAKEIKEQHLAWNKVIKEADENGRDNLQFVRSLNSAEMVFIGCGTSYYLSLSGAATYQGVTGEPARAVTASDVFLYPQSLFPRNGKYFGIPISRSGETTETIWAAKYLKQSLNVETMALSCRPDSQLVRVSDRSFLAPYASEESVVMTKSFTTMLLFIQMLSASKAGNLQYQAELEKLPEIGESVIEKYESVAREIAGIAELDHFIFLGQGPYYGLACEGMLKMKEMSLSIAEAYHSMEFRHGPISILDKNVLVVFLISEYSKAQEVKVLRDVKALGAKTLVICEKIPDDEKPYCDYLVELNSGLSDYARLNLYMPILQFLGCHRAVSKGLNPDRPRHLSQVVVLG